MSSTGQVDAEDEWLRQLGVSLEERLAGSWPEPELDWKARDWIEALPPASISFTLGSDDTLST